MNIPKTLAELHHAYIASCGVGELCDALERRGVPRVGCPDVYIYECQQFSVDEARALIERASMNPLVLSRRIFIISAALIHREAQNALLKTLEEPRGQAVFFFLVPAPERFLPTFRSRAHIIAPSRESDDADQPFSVEQFLKAKPPERIKMLEVFTKKKDDEERDFRSIMRFLDGLERAVARAPEGLRAVYLAKRYMADNGALVKPLLEQMAVLI